MSDYTISAHAVSDVSKRRSNNEDNYFLNNYTVNSALNAHASVENAKNFVGSVCDGMGGEAAGEIASQIAVETVGIFVQQIIEAGATDSVIENLVFAANDAVCKEIRERKKRIGTTFTLLCEKDGIITASNVGDSRIYRYSEGVLTQVSKDHTQAQRYVDSGAMSMEASMKIKEKHALTQHIGIFPQEMIIEPYTVRFNAVDGDIYILCSDGLTDMLSENEIKEILNKKMNPADMANALVELAISNGGRDNVTVMVCAVSCDDAKNNIKKKQTSSKSESKHSAAFAVVVILLLLVLAVCYILGSKFGFDFFGGNKNQGETETISESLISTSAPHI